MTTKKIGTIRQSGNENSELPIVEGVYFLGIVQQFKSSEANQPLQSFETV